ncbi:MAG: hypothetical protein WDO24_02450 [Pseudomonadota bacterium]
MTPVEKLREKAKGFRVLADQAPTPEEALVFSSRAAAYEVHANMLEESSPAPYAEVRSAS